MSERLIVRVDAPPDRQGVLRVEDAFEHILEVFELAKASGEPNAGQIVWRLVSASMNSPLTVVAEAVGLSPGVDVDRVAREQKRRLASNMNMLRAGTVPPAWAHSITRNTARDFIRRHRNQIGKTEIILSASSDEAPEEKIEVTPQEAVQSLVAFENLTADINRIKPKDQIGSVEGFFVQVTTYFHKPAIVMKVRRTGKAVTCIVSDENKEKIASEANFDDVWSGRRMVVSGRLEYDAHGELHKIIANNIRLVEGTAVSLDQLRDDDFTNGQSTAEYLENFREGNLG